MDSILLLGSDDEKLKKFLAKMGYALTDGGAGDNLAELLTSSIVDLILIDSKLGVSGVELCRFLHDQELTKAVPIVYISQDDQETSEVKGLRLPKLEIVRAPTITGTSASINNSYNCSELSA